MISVENVDNDQDGLLIQPSKKKDEDVDFFKNRSNNNIFLETSKE